MKVVREMLYNATHARDAFLQALENKLIKRARQTRQPNLPLHRPRWTA